LGIDFSFFICSDLGSSARPELSGGGETLVTWTRPRDAVEKALEIQCSAIRASSEAYDAGEWWEALRLATAIYIVVHDSGKRTTSILTQLGIRGRLRFVASGFRYSPRNVLRETHLLSTRVYGDGTAEYRPLLDGAAWPARSIQFGEWWEKELIFRDGQFSLTRKSLTFSLRNQEGGAHLDPTVTDPNYLRFAKEQLTTPYVVAHGSPPKPILGAELASMRQIAWELLKTLEAKDD
jgi:hypothetical protein